MTERVLSQVVELDLPRCGNTYGVAPCTAAGAPGSECYNTFGTCQDKPNFTPTVQTVRFTNIGAPINPAAPARPYISRLSRAVTEADPEEGLARRSAASVVLVDEKCPDVEFDPYIATRPTVAGGTFWTRLLARTKNYGGRLARVKQGYVDHGVFGAYSTELYVIDSIKGPGASGEVTVTLKDITKLADRSTTPLPTSGTLAADLALSDLVIPLNAGAGAQYDASGWVRINDEVIRYSSVAGDSLILPGSSYRAQFDTEAKTASLGDGVQQCAVWIDAAWSTVVIEILENAGIDPAYIDVAGIVAEDNTWLGVDYRITRCVSSPEDNADLLVNLLKGAQAMLWWDPEAQLVTVRVFAPQSPASVVALTLTEAANLLDRTPAAEPLDEIRITLAAAYFGLRTPVANVDEAKNYNLGEVAVDVDAESVNEYDERRVQTFYMPWFNDANTLGMRTFVRRFVGRHRDTPQDLSFDADPKDKAVKVGAIADVQTSALVDVTGAARTVRIFVTRKEDLGDRLKLKGRITTFDRRYGFIAPAGTPNFPNNNGYACISDAAGFMSDGSDAFLII